MIRTKIIATLGPASHSTEIIGHLIDAGVDLFRLNLAHGTLEQQGRTLEHIHAARQDRGVHVAVLADLCGPKIRVDPVQNEAFPISSGDRIDIVADHLLGNAERISTSRPAIIGEAAVGHRILIDDGLICLRVERTSPDRLVCLCETGGLIRTRKGVNLPDSELAMPSLTDKDHRDLTWALAHDLDYLALSFVRCAEDLHELRRRIQQAGSTCPVVAKIETPQAIEHLDEIIEAADLVLVARGDLGVEMDLARLPLLQKEITHKCHQAGKPVIIATQMLQSMVEHPTPTRAEVSDVANAIFDAADCVMLSAETSIGAYPVQSVRMMDRIAEQTEAHLSGSGEYARMDAELSTNPAATALAKGAALLARELKARLIVAWTTTGETVRLLSKCRPDRPVIGLSPDPRLCRRMMPYYGVYPVCLSPLQETAAMLRAVDEILLQRDLAAADDLIVVAARTRVDQTSTTDTLLIHRVTKAAEHPA